MVNVDSNDNDIVILIDINSTWVLEYYRDIGIDNIETVKTK